MMRTFCTAIQVDVDTDTALSSYAELFSKVERTLHADLERAIAAGAPVKAQSFKNAYLPRFGLTARQFNAVRITLDGRRDSIKELRKGEIFELGMKITRATRELAQVAADLASCKSEARRRKLMLKKSRLHGKAERLAAQKLRVKADQAAGRVRLCFGSKKSFNAQHYLEENQYDSHEQWLEGWRESRANQFTCVGSKDETAGNQSCVATLQPDGTLSLRLRLPDALIKDGNKYAKLFGVQFHYGDEAIKGALEAGQALTYRFMRVSPGKWRIALTINVPGAEKIVTHSELGRLGVDINAGFLLVTEIDRFGNKLVSRRLNTPERGVTAHQRDAARGEAVKALVQWAKSTGKPIVLEELELAGKKQGRNVETKRKVSALAYAAIRQRIEARAFDHGVAVEIVDPAYSSVQGQLKAVSHGLTVHGGASLVLARRGMGYSERIPNSASRCRLAVRSGVIWWQAPVRIPAGNEAAAWRSVGASIRQALAAHYRGPSRAQSGSVQDAAVVMGENPMLSGASTPEI